MSFRVHNAGTPALIVETSRVSLATSRKSAATLAHLIAAQKEGTVQIPEGVYTENVNVPDGVHLIGNGVVRVEGVLTLLGNGMIRNLQVTRLIIKGNRSVENCVAERATFEGGDSYLFHTTIEKGTQVINGNLVARMCSLDNEEKEYALHVSAAICVLDSCTLKGCTWIEKSVLDCKRTEVIGDADTFNLFETQDEETTVQLFGCTVFGDKKIKVGPGTSIRANVIALGTATEFEGGVNVLKQGC